MSDYDELGILGSTKFGGGARRAFSVEHELTREGAQFKTHCTGCGAYNGIMIEWPELIVAAEGLCPANWAYDASAGALVPRLVCFACNNKHGPGLAVHIFPSECRKFVQAGLMAGHIQPAHVAATLAAARGHQHQPR